MNESGPIQLSRPCTDWRGLPMRATDKQAIAMSFEFDQRRFRVPYAKVPKRERLRLFYVIDAIP